ncbi:MAG: hypothetical protein ABSH13_14470 [Candidatus Acidiferrum sp.]|jgi:hypothetical protein
MTERRAANAAAPEGAWLALPGVNPATTLTARQLAISFGPFFVVISLLRYFISSFFIPNKKRNPVPRSSNLLERLAHASFARYQSKV